MRRNFTFKLVGKRLVHRCIQCLEACCVVLMVMVAPALEIPVSAQKVPYAWDELTIISPDDQAVDEVYAFGDPAGNLHVVWNAAQKKPGEKATYELKDRQSLYYSHLDSDGWREPLDVVYEPNGLRLPRGLVDGQSYIHLFWASDCIRHKVASQPDAASIQAWNLPDNCVAPSPSTSFSVTRDAQDRFYLTYSDDSNIWLLISKNQGIDWESIMVAGPNGPRSMWVGEPVVAVDENGGIHIAWSEYPEEFYPCSGIYYIRSEDGGVNWSAPFRIADDKYAEPNIATADGGIVHIVFGAAAMLSGRYDRYSLDQGQTWSAQKVVVDPQDTPTGLARKPAIVVDSADSFHIFATVECGGRHMQWSLENGWSPLEQIPGFCYNPQAVILNGNNLHILGLNGTNSNIVYSAGNIDAPFVPPLPFPTPKPMLTPTAHTSPEASPTPFGGQAAELARRAAPYQSAQPGIPLILGAGSAVALLVLVSLWRLRRQK